MTKWETDQQRRRYVWSVWMTIGLISVAQIIGENDPGIGGLFAIAGVISLVWMLYQTYMMGRLIGLGPGMSVLMCIVVPIPLALFLELYRLGRRCKELFGPLGPRGKDPDKGNGQSLLRLFRRKPTKEVLTRVHANVIYDRVSDLQVRDFRRAVVIASSTAACYTLEWALFDSDAGSGPFRHALAEMTPERTYPAISTAAQFFLVELLRDQESSAFLRNLNLTPDQLVDFVATAYAWDEETWNFFDQYERLVREDYARAALLIGARIAAVAGLRGEDMVWCTMVQRVMHEFYPGIFGQLIQNPV